MFNGCVRDAFRTTQQIFIRYKNDFFFFLVEEIKFDQNV